VIRTSPGLVTSKSRWPLGEAQAIELVADRI